MPSNPQVYLDISIGTKAGGRVVFELFNDVAPRAVENFRGLCTGEYGVSKRTGLPLCYKGCKFFRVVPGFIAQSGDIELNDGQGGESIYGKDFADESFLRRHCQAGVLAMANKGRNTNNSQFFVTLKRCPQLDGRHVAFGQVVEGMEVIRAIEKCPIGTDDAPRVPIVITDCGQLRRAPGQRRHDAMTQMRESVQLLMSSLECPPDEEQSDERQKKRKGPTEAQLGLQHLQKAVTEAKGQERREQSISSDAPHTALVEESEEADWEALVQRSRKPVIENLETGSSSKKVEDFEPTSSESDEAASSVILDASDERQVRLAELRLKLNESRRLNAKEVAEEVKRNANPAVQKRVLKTQLQEALEEAQLSEDDKDEEKEAKKKKRKASSEGWSLHESASIIQARDDIQRKKQENMAKAFGWNAMNVDASYRAHKKRTADLKLQPEEYAKQMLQLGDHFYDPTAVLVSAEFKPTETAKDRLVAAVEKAKEKRKSFHRRRMYIEEENVQYINESNRTFNQKLERAFGAHSLEIRQNLERGTAL